MLSHGGEEHLQRKGNFPGRNAEEGADGSERSKQGRKHERQDRAARAGGMGVVHEDFSVLFSLF